MSNTHVNITTHTNTSARIESQNRVVADLIHNIMVDRHISIMKRSIDRGSDWELLDKTLHVLSDRKQSFKAAAQGVSAFLQPLLFYFLSTIATKLKLPFLIPLFLSLQSSRSSWQSALAADLPYWVSDSLIAELSRDTYTYDTFPPSPPPAILREFERQPTNTSFHHAFHLLSIKREAAIIVSLHLVDILRPTSTKAHAVTVVYKWKDNRTIVKYIVDTAKVISTTHDMAIPFVLSQTYLQTFERPLLKANRDCQMILDRCVSNVQSNYGICSSMSFAVTVTALSPLSNAAHREIGGICRELSAKRRANDTSYNAKLKDYITLMWTLLTDLFVAYIWNPTFNSTLKRFPATLGLKGTSSDFLDTNFRNQFIASIMDQLSRPSTLPREANNAITSFGQFFKTIRLLE